MKTKREVYNHFKIIAYPAELVGDEHLIQQHLTHRKCHHNQYYCTPQEMPKNHLDNNIAHSIGRIIGTTLSRLGTGGTRS